jgi:hypothetical protein
MSLTFIAKDPNTNGTQCPTVWVDQPRQELVIQGWKAGAELLAECLMVGPIPDTEAVIRIPFRMISDIRKALDAAERQGVC